MRPPCEAITSPTRPRRRSVPSLFLRFSMPNHRFVQPGIRCFRLWLTIPRDALRAHRHLDLAPPNRIRRESPLDPQTDLKASVENRCDFLKRIGKLKSTGESVANMFSRLMRLACCVSINRSSIPQLLKRITISSRDEPDLLGQSAFPVLHYITKHRPVLYRVRTSPSSPRCSSIRRSAACSTSTRSPSTSDAAILPVQSTPRSRSGR